MKQFIINQSCSSGSELVLRDEEFHYLCHVRRCRKNQQLTVRDSRGYCFNALISEMNDRSCSILIQEEIEKQNRVYELELYCCLPKGKKLDLIIRQATETGVSRIIPLYSDHSLISYQSDNDFNKKALRWQKIIKEARQQSGSPVVTELLPPRRIPDLPEIQDNEAGYYCHQDYIRENSLSLLFNKRPEIIKMLIGPEGGLSDSEVRILDERKFTPLYLGSNVLRTETASLFAISTIVTAMELV